MSNMKLPEETPKRESFFSLTSRLNDLSKKQKNASPSADDAAPEAKDYIAMIISAFLTIFLPTVLVLGVLVVIVMGIFGIFG